MMTTADSLEASDFMPNGLGPIPRGKLLKYSSSFSISLELSPGTHKGSPVWAILTSSSMAATANSTMTGLSASVGTVTDLRRSQLDPNISPTKPDWAPKFPTPMSRERVDTWDERWESDDKGLPTYLAAIPDILSIWGRKYAVETISTDHYIHCSFQ